jgi:hypothetical protein
MKEKNNIYKYIFAFIIAVMSVFIIVAGMSGCNKQIIDTNYTFNRAIINTGSEVIEVKVKSWKDFEDGDQIQIKAEDGTTYLVHSSNVTLIHDDND